MGSLGKVRPTTCMLDPCPSGLLRKADRGVLLQWANSTLNASLTSGWVTKVFAAAVVNPLLKKEPMLAASAPNH